MVSTALSPCWRCESTRVRSWISLKQGVGRTVDKSYRIFCENCQLSSKEFAGGDLEECRLQAEHYWNFVFPRIRIASLEGKLTTAISEVEKTKTLGKQRKLPF